MATNAGTLIVFEGTDRDLDFTHSGNDASTATAILFTVTDDPGVTTLNGKTAISKTLGAGITAPDSTSIIVALADTDLDGFGGVLGYFDLRVTDASGNEDVVAFGVLDIRPSNTD